MHRLARSSRLPRETRRRMEGGPCRRRPGQLSGLPQVPSIPVVAAPGIPLSAPSPGGQLNGPEAAVPIQASRYLVLERVRGGWGCRVGLRRWCWTRCCPGPRRFFAFQLAGLRCPFISASIPSLSAVPVAVARRLRSPVSAVSCRLLAERHRGRAQVAETEEQA